MLQVYTTLRCDKIFKIQYMYEYKGFCATSLAISRLQYILNMGSDIIRLSFDYSTSTALHYPLQYDVIIPLLQGMTGTSARRSRTLQPQSQTTGSSHSLPPFLIRTPYSPRIGSTKSRSLCPTRTLSNPPTGISLRLLREFWISLFFLRANYVVQL